MPLVATKILADYIEQMRNLHSEVIQTWKEIKVRCKIPGSLVKKVQSFDVLLNLVDIQHGLLQDEVPNVKKEFKRQLSVRDTRIKELVAKLDRLSPSMNGGRPPYVGANRRYPKSTTPAQRRSQRRQQANRAPVPRMVSADDVRGGPMTYSPFYCSRTPYISASPSTASKHAQSPVSQKSSGHAFSPKAQQEWTPKQMEAVEDDIINEIARMSVEKLPSQVSPRTRKAVAHDLRNDLKRTQRQRERVDLKEASISPRTPKSAGSWPEQRSPRFGDRSPRTPKLPEQRSELKPQLVLPNRMKAEGTRPMISPRSIPQIPPASSHAKKDPTKSPTQEEMIRKEFEALGIDYTSEDVLKVNEKAGSASNLDPIQTFSPTPKATATPLEKDPINFEEMSQIVIKNDTNSVDETPNRRQSRGRRPSLCRKNELSDWVDTEEGRNAAKQLEEDMIKELARLSTQSLNLTAKERVKQESLLIQGLTEHQGETKPANVESKRVLEPAESSEWLEGVQSRLLTRIRRASVALVPTVENGGYGPHSDDESDDDYSRSESELSILQ